MASYLKLFRSMTEWEHYKDPVISRVFLHLLLSASYKERWYNSHKIGVGSLMTTYEAVGEALSLTPRQVKYAFGKLRESGEIESTRHGRYAMVRIKNYERYQSQTEKRSEKQSKGDKPQVPREFTAMFGDDYEAYVAWRNQ